MKKHFTIPGFLTIIFVCIILYSCGNNYNENIIDTNDNIIIPEENEKIFIDIENLLNSVDEDYIRYYSSESLEKFLKMKNEFNSYSKNAYYSVLEGYKEKVEKSIEELKYRYNDIPQIFINDVSELPLTTEYTSVTVAFIDPQNKNNDTIIDKNAQLKIRGNISAQIKIKSSFTLKLSSDQSVFGMHEENKWVLLANTFDKSLIRTSLAYTFSSYLRLPCTPNFRYVDLWINSEYKGNYLFVEPADNVYKRVVERKTGKEFLIEKNISREEEDIKYIKSNLLKLRFEINEPENASEDQINWLQNFLNETDAAVNSVNMENYEKYIDVNSFVDYYILYELIKDIDFGVFSTRYYICDNKIYCSPVWDVDMSMGNISDERNVFEYRTYLNYDGGEEGWGDKSGDSTHGLWINNDWYRVLIRDENFRKLVYARYIELSDKIVNLYEDNEFGKNVIDTLYENHKTSLLRNYTDTGLKLDILYGPYESRETFETYEEYLESLRNWLKNRHEWLLNNIGK